MTYSMRIALAVAIGMASLTGCQHTPTKIVREVHSVPTPYVPAPPATTHPTVELEKVTITKPFDKMTESEKGAIIKAYHVTAVQWKTYALGLEMIVDQYRTASAETKVIADKILAEIEAINAQAAEELRKIRIRDEAAKLESDVKSK